jgi:hypothetical protein
LTIILHKGQPNPSNSRHVCCVFSCMVNSCIWNQTASDMSKSKLCFPNFLLNKTKGLLKKKDWCFWHLLHSSKIIITRLLNQEWGLLQKPCWVFSPQKIVLYPFFFFLFACLALFFCVFLFLLHFFSHLLVILGLSAVMRQWHFLATHSCVKTS